MEDLIIMLATLKYLEWQELSLTRKSRQGLHSRWESLPARDKDSSETDQEEE
jgi:hypothetical protein